MKAIWPLLMLFCMHAAYACIAPEAGMVLETPAELCAGEFLIREGLTTTAHLICNGTVLIGEENGAGMTVRNGGTVYGCGIRNFQIGILALDARDGTLSGNSLRGNEVGIALIQSQNLTVVRNTLYNNSEMGLTLTGSWDNIIAENTFIITGMDNVSDTANAFCRVAPNTYRQGAEGPGCIDNREVHGQVAEGRSAPDVQPSDTIDPLSEIIRDQGIDISKIEQTLAETRQRIRLTKDFQYDESQNRTEISIQVTITDTVRELYLYEYVPKCMAEHVADMEFSRPPRIIHSDPLFVWHFTDIDVGDDIEVFYSVPGKVDAETATTAIADDQIAVEGEAVCTSTSFPLGDCPTRRRLWLYFPIIFIPIIAALYFFVQTRRS